MADVIQDDGDGEDVVISVQTQLILVAGVCSILALCISLWTVWRHLNNYRAPEKQRRIVRILLMVPIYAISSWLSLSFVSAALYFDTLRDIYEAYVLYQFFLLCVSYLGGEAAVKRILSLKPAMDYPWPFAYCCPKVAVSNPKFYLHLKRGILQYSVVKPVWAALAVILEATGNYNNGSWNFSSGYMYHTIANNLSVTLSLYCLVMFYECTSTELSPWKPIWKFVCVKAVIFFSYWQGVIFSLLVFSGVLVRVGSYTTDDLATGLQDFLVCLEMLIASVAHFFVFGHEDYLSLEKQCLDFVSAIVDVISITDIIYDTRTTFHILPPEYQRLENHDDLRPRGHDSRSRPVSTYGTPECGSSSSLYGSNTDSMLIGDKEPQQEGILTFRADA